MSKRPSTGTSGSDDPQNLTDNGKKVKTDLQTDQKKTSFSMAPKKGIQIKLSSQKDSTIPAVKLKAPSVTVASVFGDESDDEPEEMPPEAKMRMRNIGRDTPTSAGPNSYGKTKHGFCNTKKVFERNLKDAEEECTESSPMTNMKK